MTKKLTYDDVKDVVMPFGKHKGKTLDSIAEKDSGLKYLDWLVGQDWLKGDLKKCLVAYLSDPTVKADLERILGGDEE